MYGMSTEDFQNFGVHYKRIVQNLVGCTTGFRA